MIDTFPLLQLLFPIISLTMATPHKSFPRRQAEKSKQEACLTSSDPLRRMWVTQQSTQGLATAISPPGMKACVCTDSPLCATHLSNHLELALVSSLRLVSRSHHLLQRPNLSV